MAGGYIFRNMTRSEWDSLTQSEKDKYRLVSFKDDCASNSTNIGISSIDYDSVSKGCITLSNNSISTTTSSGIISSDLVCSALQDTLEDTLDSLQKDNLNSIEDIKARLAEQDARIQQLESEIEILKSQNTDKFSNNTTSNANLADFF